MTERIEVGKVCYKGNHVYFVGDSDYGTCGSHEYATVYMSLEIDYPNPRGEKISLEDDIVSELRTIVQESEKFRWLQ